MQSTTISHSHANIIDEVKNWFKTWAELNQRAMDAASGDPDASLPKMLILFWILVGICVVICTSFGVAYHYAIFKSVSGSRVMGAVAASLFLLVVEITTVFLGLYLFDAILEKMWWRSIKRATLVLGIGTIVFFAVRWSVNISTNGVAEVNRQLKIDRAYHDTEFVMPAEVAEIEEKIAKAEAIIDVGTRSTWRGRPTKEGLDLLQANTELKRDLSKQKETIILAEMARQDSIMSNRKNEAVYTSTLLIEYGGKAEYAKLFGLFMISLIGSILREKKEIAEDGKK